MIGAITLVARDADGDNERLSLSTPSHVGKEVKWKGKVIHLFGSILSIAHF